MSHDDFNVLDVSALETLWEEERCLGSLYPQLQTKLQLREFFLREIANFQQRTKRLQTVLKVAKKTREAMSSFNS
jgi:hypothetical protein